MNMYLIACVFFSAALYMAEGCYAVDQLEGYVGGTGIQTNGAGSPTTIAVRYENCCAQQNRNNFFSPKPLFSLKFHQLIMKIKYLTNKFIVQKFEMWILHLIS